MNEPDVDAPTRVRLLTEALTKHVAMVAIVPSNTAAATDIMGNATVSFLETPERKLLLTNAHVWKIFQETRQETPSAELVLIGSGSPVQMTHLSPIAFNEDRDLAVFPCDNPAEVESMEKAFYKPKQWPIRPPGDGDQVFFVGYPAIHRKEKGNAVHAVASLFGPRVSGVNARSMRLAFTSNDVYTLKFQEGLQPFGSLKGVSGSALYRLIPGTTSLDLAGCVFATADDLQGMKAATLDCLRADGTI